MNNKKGGKKRGKSTRQMAYGIWVLKTSVKKEPHGLTIGIIPRASEFMKVANIKESLNVDQKNKGVLQLTRKGESFNRRGTTWSFPI